MRANGLGELDVVLAVARHRSFRGAASELGITSSAVSQAIAVIEARVGVLLFHRNTRSVSLTDAGRIFSDTIAPALQTIRDATDQLSSQRTSSSGTLRINGSVRSIRQSMPMLLAFIKQFPLIQLDLKGEDRLVDIISDGFDIGIRLGSFIAKDMIAVPFGKPQRYVVVASDEYLSNHGKITKPNCLLKHQCVKFRTAATGSSAPWEFTKSGKLIAIDPPGNLIVDSSYLARELVLRSFGVAYCSHAFVADDLAAGSLVSLLEDWVPDGERLNLYFPNRRHLPGSFRALVDFAKLYRD